MIKHRIILSVCLVFSMAMAIGNSFSDNLPMTIMWGAISIIETVLFCIVVVCDVNVATGVTEDGE